MISWLRGQKTAGAVEALRGLEQRFGKKYPWLRRPRSSAERAYRQSHWNPIPPASVAELLHSNRKRLIRSQEDAVAGVIEAIRDYEWRLRHENPSPLEELWNRPTGKPPTKEEERISDKLCEYIRRYFRERAVAAAREVQVFRRSVAKDDGGAPGSGVDVLVTEPAAGAATASPISVPIEVKRSVNREARTGFREQLVDRYMSELGTSCGAFIVAWLTAPNLPRAHTPVWKTLDEAKEDLRGQADTVMAENEHTLLIASIVLDASLK